MNNVEHNKQKISEAFNNLNSNTIEALDSFYASNAELIDPVSTHRGLNQIKNYYRHMYKNVSTIRFDFDRIEFAENTYYAHWNMTMQVRGLNSFKPYSLEGISVIRLNQENLVVYHRDYFDMGAMVYEKIPVLGQLISRIKSMMRV